MSKIAHNVTELPKRFKRRSSFDIGTKFLSKILNFFFFFFFKSTSPPTSPSLLYLNSLQLICYGSPTRNLSVPGNLQLNTGVSVPSSIYFLLWYFSFSTLLEERQ